MYEIYDFQLQRVVKESCNLQVLIESAKRRKHHVMVQDKYSHYEFFKNFGKEKRRANK